MSEQHLPAVQKSYDICRWLLPVVSRLPRQYKFTLGDRLQVTSLDLTLALVEASHARAKERPLHRASRLLDQLRLLLRLAVDVDLLSARSHAFIAEQIGELGRMLGGWLKHSTRAAASEPPQPAS